MPIRTTRRSSRPRALAGTLGLAVWFAAAPAAAEHRARLSADLADQLAAGSQSIDVIVHGDVDAIAARYNLVVKRRLRSGAVLHVNAGQLDALQRDEAVDHLSGDIRVQSTAYDVTAEAIGADQVWAGADGLPPLTGKGATIAVIDSGIDERHNALKKRVLHTEDFIGGDGRDAYGHGTHVAGIVAGQGGRTADTRDLKGIAYGAYLLNLRVLDGTGAGTASSVVEAIDWAVEHREEYNVRVINLSLGAPVLQPYRDDPMCEAVERAVRAGITVVAAAGNYGKTPAGTIVFGLITTPGNSPYALTVGAIDTHGTAKRSDDTLASYSSRGPTRYDLILKPDLAAPGSHIISAEATDSYLAIMHPERHVAGNGPNAFMQLSGTSMAAAVVSGAVSLIVDQDEGLRPAAQKQFLQLGSSFISDAGLVGAGAGNLNVLAACLIAKRPDNTVASTLIGGETTSSDRISFDATGIAGTSLVWGALRVVVNSDSLVWGALTVSNSSLVWGATAAGVSGTSLVWGASGDALVWGANGDALVWGASGDALVWGASGDALVWGASGDALVWGASGDALVWGA